MTTDLIFFFSFGFKCGLRPNCFVRVRRAEETLRPLLRQRTDSEPSVTVVSRVLSPSPRLNRGPASDQTWNKRDGRRNDVNQMRGGHGVQINFHGCALHSKIRCEDGETA